MLHRDDKIPDTIDPRTNEKLIRAKKRAIVLFEPPKLFILRGKTGSKKKTEIYANTQTKMIITTLMFLKNVK